ncbi:sensor histidine kinase [Embleya sp. NPDC050154]|uniref:sensor histidine kinase n=1 Tax=Embleya sp. NPDC050154 TaxID=3363988 RepID=UPI0037900490
MTTDWTGLLRTAFRLRDIAVAAVLLAYAVTALALSDGAAGATRGPDVLALVVVGLMTGALAVRRRFPLPVLVVNLACVAVFQLRGYADEPPVVAILIALYTVAAVGERRRSVKVGAVVAVLVQVMLVGTEPQMHFSDVLDAAMMVVLALALGEAVRYQQAYRAEVAERHAREEVHRAEEAERLLGEERIRIARDLHDVLAHSIAAINVQASVAAHLLGQDAELDARTRTLLRSTMDTITEISRSGVADLRATLAVLRGHGPASHGPLPGLARLGELADMVTATGARIDVDIVGSAPPLPAGHDVTAFRIIQEALTNVVKHARARRVLVRIEYGHGQVDVSVRDDGVGRVRRRADAGAGFGLLGMTERAHSVGGRLTAADRPDGGFEVVAVLPLPDHERYRPAAAMPQVGSPAAE